MITSVPFFSLSHLPPPTDIFSPVPSFITRRTACDEIDRDRAVQLIAETTVAAASPVATEIHGNSARFYRKAVVLISARPKIADEANERWFVAVTFGKLPCPPPPPPPPSFSPAPIHPLAHSSRALSVSFSPRPHESTGIFNFVHKSVMEESLRVPVDRNEAPPA